MNFIDSILSLHRKKSFRNSLLMSISLTPITCSCHDDCSSFIKNAPELNEHVSALDDFLVCLFTWLSFQGFLKRCIQFFTMICLLSSWVHDE